MAGQRPGVRRPYPAGTLWVSGVPSRPGARGALPGARKGLRGQSSNKLTELQLHFAATHSQLLINKNGDQRLACSKRGSLSIFTWARRSAAAREFDGSRSWR